MAHNSKEVAKYFLDRASEKGLKLTPMQLLKLVYIAHGWMLGLYSKPLIHEDVEAWEYGPVIPELYHAIKYFRHMPVQEIPGVDTVSLEADESDLVDQVLELYGEKNGIYLSTITHQEDTPWYKTWNRDGKNGVISNDIIESHYADLYRAANRSAKETEGEAFA